MALGLMMLTLVILAFVQMFLVTSCDDDDGVSTEQRRGGGDGCHNVELTVIGVIQIALCIAMVAINVYTICLAHHVTRAKESSRHSVAYGELVQEVQEADVIQDEADAQAARPESHAHAHAHAAHAHANAHANAHASNL